MKKSELTAFIKEEILSTLSENTTIESDVKKYIEMLDELKEKFPSGKVKAKASALIGDLLDYINMNEVTDKEVENQRAYNDELEKTVKLSKEAGLTEEEDDDSIDDEELTKKAPSGDVKLQKKATKQDQVINNYKRLQKDLKKHLEMYKDAEGDLAKNAALQMMKKISQSAEYLDAKAKYEKLKQVKI